MDKAIGRCSHCGGTVTVPSIWHGVNPPTPTCSNCGATASNRHLPVIDMDPPSTTDKYVEPDYLQEFAEALRDIWNAQDDFDEWGYRRRYGRNGW